MDTLRSVQQIYNKNPDGFSVNVNTRWYTMQELPPTKCAVGDCRAQSKYECPRCAVKYCSVNCYRKHSTRCVKAFATDGQSHLQGVTVSDVDRRQSNRVLRKLIEECDQVHDADNVVDFTNDVCATDDDDVEDVADVLETLAEEIDEGTISLEEALQRLPRELVSDFDDMLRDGRIARMLSLWTPWWINDHDSNLPSLPDSTKSMVTPAKARKLASTLVAHSITAVLCAYCYALRVYNGDWSSDASTFVRLVFEHCGVLACDERHESDECVLQTFVRGCKSTGAAIAAVGDAATIYGGRADWTCRALGDLLHALRSCGGRRGVVRKLTFFLAWASGGNDAEFVMKARMLQKFVVAHDEQRIVKRALYAVNNNTIRYK